MTTPDHPFEPLSVAVRAYATAETPARTARRSAAGAPPQEPGGDEDSQRSLVIDCETTTDVTQRLLYGAWRLYLDRPGTPAGTVCAEEGIFYADDLPERDPDGYASIAAYAETARAQTGPGRSNDLTVMPRSKFVESLLWKWAHRWDATVVGYNLPFDLSRLATHASSARGGAKGGISLRLYEHNGANNGWRSWIQMRNIDGHRTLMNFTRTREPGPRVPGRFLDLRTLAFAHTDDRSLTLETACERFGETYEKRPVTHGIITPENLTYCREDVAATAKLYRATAIEHDRHPIELRAESTFSAASLAKGYWRAMGIAPTAERHPDFPAEVTGWGMEAFYGGRAECRIRRTAVPVVYCDFQSMYMTCNALMDTWPLLTAEHLTLDNVTAEVQALAAAADLAEQCFTRDLWTQLHTLVQVIPDGAILPVRARYDPAADTFGIGVNPYRSTRPSWYTLADVLAGVLLGGPVPEITAAWRLTPAGTRRGLSTVDLCGEIPFNPASECFFRAAVEHRHRTKTDQPRLSRNLKTLANSAGYGTLVELRQNREPVPVTVTVHAGENTPFTTTTTNPETPGDYFFPPVAATITGAARLMLALLEHEVTRAGGTYAMCDTDSMAIVATKTGGTTTCDGGDTTTEDGSAAVRALTWKQVDAIIDWFSALNPYDQSVVAGSILRIEDENYDPGTGRQRRIDCYAISAKRYQLDGSAKRSEHGLGHLLNPDPGTNWIDDAWTHLRNPLGHEPWWLDLPAVSRITVSSAEILNWFADFNRDKPYADQIKPGNFLLVAHPDPLDASGAQPVAPYERDPNQWADLPWIDRRTGQPIRLHTGPLDGTRRTGTVHVRSYRTLLARYHAHPETKSLAPDGTPVRPDTTGLLARRPIEAIQPVHHTGKESNDLDQRATGTAHHDHTTTYEHPTETDWDRLVLPALATIPTATITQATGIGRRTIQRALAGRTRPHPKARRTLTDYATDHARAHPEMTGRNRSPRTTLHRYLQITAPSDLAGEQTR